MFAEACMSGNDALRKVDLSLNQKLGETGITAVSELFLDNLPCVEDFTMMGCALENAGTDIIVVQLGANESCKKIDLSYNDITDGDMFGTMLQL